MAQFLRDALSWCHGFCSGVSTNNRGARFYKLTRAGRKQLSVEESQWEYLSLAIKKVMQVT